MLPHHVCSLYFLGRTLLAMNLVITTLTGYFYYKIIKETFGRCPVAEEFKEGHPKGAINVPVKVKEGGKAGQCICRFAVAFNKFMHPRS